MVLFPPSAGRDAEVALSISSVPKVVVPMCSDSCPASAESGCSSSLSAEIHRGNESKSTFILDGEPEQNSKIMLYVF